jgi:hypothetical protein
MAHEKVALAIAREIPAPFNGRFLDSFHQNAISRANGNGCGNGCGNNCIDAVGLAFDRFGQSGLTHEELEAAHKDSRALRAAMETTVTRALK